MARLSDSAALRLLNDCCLERTLASILWPERGVLCCGVFSEFSGDRVTFEIVSKYCSPFRAEASCCVAFNAQDRLHLFLGCVAKWHEVSRSGSCPKLALAIRSEIVAAERRRGLRVPVLKDSDLHVEVRTDDGQTWPAKAINLSVTGVLVEFPAGRGPELALGETVRVGLTLDNSTIELAAAVKHRGHGPVGLFFHDTVVRETLRPPPALATMVQSLERQWLTRVGKQAGGEAIAMTRLHTRAG